MVEQTIGPTANNSRQHPIGVWESGNIQGMRDNDLVVDNTIADDGDDATSGDVACY